MKHSVAHDLGEEEAKKVANAAFESYKARFAKYRPTATWAGEKHADISFSVKGLSLKGSVDLKPKSFDLDLQVPFLLKPFRGKALGVIEEEIRKWIGKAKGGNL